MPPIAAHKPPPPRSPQEADDSFALSAKKIADAVRKDAKGRTCGACANAWLNESGEGVCTTQANIHGVSLSIVRRDAVACKVGYAASK